MPSPAGGRFRDPAKEAVRKPTIDYDVAVELAKIHSELDQLGADTAPAPGATRRSAPGLVPQIYGNGCDRVVYFVCALMATLVALASVVAAANATRTYTWSTSIHIEQQSVISMPEMEFCVQNFSPYVWAAITTRFIDFSNPERTAYPVQMPPPDPELSVEVNDGLEFANQYCCDLAPPLATRHSAVETKLSIRTVEVSGMPVQSYCLTVPDGAYRPTSVDDALEIPLDITFECLLLGEEELCVENVVMAGSLALDGKKSYFDVWSEFATFAFAARETTTNDRFGASTSTTEWDMSVVNLNTRPSTPPGNGTHLKVAFSVLSKPGSMLLQRSTIDEVPQGTWESVYAAVGGAAGTVALILSLFFTKLNNGQLIPRWYLDRSKITARLKDAGAAETLNVRYGHDRAWQQQAGGPVAVASSVTTSKYMVRDDTFGEEEII